MGKAGLALAYDGNGSDRGDTLWQVHNADPMGQKELGYLLCA